MTFKKGVLLALILILSLSIEVYSENHNKPVPRGGENPFEENPQDSITKAIERGDNVQGTAPSGTTVSPNGISFSVGGDVSITNGDVSASELNIVNANMENVEGFRADSQDSWTTDRVERLQQGDFLLLNAIGVRFKSGVLTAEHVDSFIKQGSITTNLDNLESRQDIFSVEKADSVLSGCLRIDDIENSTFKIFNNAIEILAGKGILVDITDCSFNNVQFESNNGKVIVSKKIPPVYNIQNGSLTFKNGNITEKIDANNSVIVELDPNFGFSCIIINPPGTYWYSENLIKDFGINVPKNSSSYKLCIRKSEMQNFNDYNGLVDFPNKKIELNKIVNYLRHTFDEKNQLLSLLMDFVYQSFDINNNATLILDNDFVFINNLFIENNNAKTNGTVSFVNNGNYAVYEYSNGNKITRYGRFNEKFKPNIIKKYNSNFGKEKRLIIFSDGIMLQEGLNDFGTITSVKAVCKDCIQKDVFEQEMLERSQEYEINEGRCVAWPGMPK